MPRVVLLVCGEPMRGDDGVGPAVAETLPAAVNGLADVRHVSQLMPDDLHGLAAPVIVLDAVAGVPAGTLVDLSLVDLAAAAAAGLAPQSSHALPLPLTLGVVERLDGGLPEGRFVGVGGASFEVGTPLSAEVSAAVAGCRTRVAAWIHALAAGSKGAVPCA